LAICSPRRLQSRSCRVAVVCLAGLVAFCCWTDFRLSSFLGDRGAAVATGRQSFPYSTEADGDEMSAATGRYESPIPDGVPFEDLPLPIQVIEQYKRWHSVEALEGDPDVGGRQFLLGKYHCPFTAGESVAITAHVAYSVSQ